MTMTKPSPKQKVRKVKAWTVVQSDGSLVSIRKLFLDKKLADLNVSSYADERLVRCEISYLQ